MSRVEISRYVLSTLGLLAMFMLTACEGGGQNGTNDSEDHQMMMPHTEQVQVLREPDPDPDPEPDPEPTPEPEIEQVTCELPAVLVQEIDGTYTCQTPLSWQQELEPAPVTESELNEARRIVDEYTCTDEYDQAIDYTDRGILGAAAVPVLWNEAPFVVNISSAFTNADELLDVVADEAEKISQVLGYEIFVAGEILPLADLEKDQLTFSGRQFIPPDQLIEIRCCYHPGTAYPWWRMILLPPLETDDVAFLGGHSRINLIHELYHLLGFTHPGEPTGVEMSEALDHGDFEAGTIYSASTPSDLARLACIYD